ncbi:MAG TPA: type II toxin-antitoxin system VapC family toxin [Thermoanaerobaculia bacterium]|nr:type II toxin-antitoxin system VapC family toxin [Thermoanaerobaculia bacterium]
MRFWDSSALVPLLIQQSASRRIEDLLGRDPEVVLWWATPVECRSALARVEREGRLAQSGVRQAQDLLDYLRARAFEVQPVEEVRSRAERLLAVHPLRAGDSLQLSAALLWCREHPRGVGFVCLDDRLRLAAAREGFLVMPYSEEVHEPAPPSASGLG